MRLHEAIIVVLLCTLPGCATGIKGYYSKVELKNAPDSIQVFTAEGVELPVTRTNLRVQVKTVPPQWVSRPASLIELRSKYDHTLILRYHDQEKRVMAYGKIGGEWLILSTVCGFFPAVVDALTGNWNSFEPIDASFK